MKSKVDLLHNMIKDLMKVPLEHGQEHAGAEPKGVHMTIIAAEKPHGSSDMEDPDGDGIPDAIDPDDQDPMKHKSMERAIHAKHKGMM